MCLDPAQCMGLTKIIGYLGRWNNYSRIDALQNRKCVSYPLYVRSDMQYVKIGQPYIGCLGQICMANEHKKIQSSSTKRQKNKIPKRETLDPVRLDCSNMTQ